MPVTGSLKIDVSEFPQDLLNKILSTPMRLPVLKIELPRIFLQNGMTWETRDEDSTISFEFIGLNISIEETK